MLGFGGLNSNQYGGQNAASVSGKSIPTLPYKKNYDGSFMKGADGRWALEGPEGTIQYTDMSPGEYNQFLVNREHMDLPDLVNNPGKPAAPSVGETPWYSKALDSVAGAVQGASNAVKPYLDPVAGMFGGTIPVVPVHLGQTPLGDGTVSPQVPYKDPRTIGQMVDQEAARGQYTNPLTQPGPGLDSITSGSTSLNPGSIAPTNSVGESRINLTGTEPNRVGMTPININGPSTNPSDYTPSGWKNAQAWFPDQSKPAGYGNGVSYIPNATSNAAPDAAGGSGLGAGAIGAGLQAVGAGVQAANSVAQGNNIANAEDEAAKILYNATDNAAKGELAHLDAYKTLLNSEYEKQQGYLDPYRTAGADAMTKLQNFNDANPFTGYANFGMDQFKADPGYSFRLKEGLKALENSAAAKGGYLSGNTMKGLQNYGQEAASQEYQNAFNRYHMENQNAFNRYQTYNDARRNRLQNLASGGQSAANSMVGNSQNYMNNYGNASQTAQDNYSKYNVAGANARAMGIKGAADANASGYTQGLNALVSGIGSGLSYMQGAENANVLKQLLASKLK